MSSTAGSAAAEPKTPGPEPQKGKFDLKLMWLLVAFAAMVIVLLLPRSGTLSETGQRALAILAFAVIVWVTEAVSYPVSSFAIVSMIALLIGFSPKTGVPETLLSPAAVENLSGDVIGTKQALSFALTGFSNRAFALVAVALFLAVAMQVTNLHKRLALWVLRAVGESTRAVLAGSIIISAIMAFFIPSATARAGAVIPILLGMVAAFGMAKESRLGALLVITAVQAVSIWNVGIKTGAAQNLIGTGFMEKSLGQDPSWIFWFKVAAPWSVIMSIALYFTMRLIIKPEVERIEGGREVVNRQLQEMGPVTGQQWRLIIVAVLLLFFWSTEGTFHEIDSSTITVLAIAIMLLPRIGVYNWKEAERLVNWGTLVVFAVGISLGTLLLNTGAAKWLSDQTFGQMGLSGRPMLMVIALVSIFNILIHLGFASATSLASALMPVFIALTMTLGLEGDKALGFAMIQQFVISFGFLLPISSPQGMLAYGTGTFTSKDYLKSGLPLTIVAYLLIVLLSATYWKWLGIV